MAEQLFVRAEIIGELPSGQKHVRILADGADGIRFYTGSKSLVSVSEIVDRMQRQSDCCSCRSRKTCLAATPTGIVRINCPLWAPGK